jgi:hypothetical protein
MLLLSCGLTGSAACAQSAGSASRPAATAKIVTSPKHPDKFDWTNLSVVQQQALRPLALTWSTLSDQHKQKWIALSANYQEMPPSAKDRLHERMVEWAALTPKQRTQARLNYSQTVRVPSEDKAERWEVYQSLTPEQKGALAASAPKMPLAPRVKVPKPPAQ